MDDKPTPHTYEQAAAVLGIQAEAVRGRLRRGALKRGPRMNDGRPTVLLSPADVATIRTQPRISEVDSGPDSGRTHPDESARIKALEAEATLLREALARERDRADQAATEREAARITAAFAEGEVKMLLEALARERERADGAEAVASVVPDLRERAGRGEGEAHALRRQVEAASQQAARMEAEREAARAELAAWRQGGPLTRALRAFWRRG